MNRTCFFLIFMLLTVLLINGCGNNNDPLNDSYLNSEEDPKDLELTLIAEASIKLNVWNETQTKPATDLELWVKGTGSWYPDLEFGADSKTVGPFPIDEPQELFIYPDGRGGPEIKIEFTLTSEMLSGSDRDAMILIIEDAVITITCTAIEGIEQVFER